uniref:Uncharacterized protein n=1 Tax=Anopheles atroparvus TaxID=41427 RepID=A0A182J1I9_ANOAO
MTVCEIMLTICASPVSFTTTSRHPFGDRSIAVAVERANRFDAVRDEAKIVQSSTAHSQLAVGVCDDTKRNGEKCNRSQEMVDDVLPRVQVVDGDDQTVQTQHFGENEDQNHTDEQSGLLGGTTDTGVTDNTDGETSCQAGETDGKTSTEMDEAPGELEKRKRVKINSLRNGK